MKSIVPINQVRESVASRNRKNLLVGKMMEQPPRTGKQPFPAPAGEQGKENLKSHGSVLD